MERIIVIASAWGWNDGNGEQDDIFCRYSKIIIKRMEPMAANQY